MTLPQDPGPEQIEQARIRLTNYVDLARKRVLLDAMESDEDPEVIMAGQLAQGAGMDPAHAEQVAGQVFGMATEPQPIQMAGLGSVLGGLFKPKSGAVQRIRKAADLPTVAPPLEGAEVSQIVKVKPSTVSDVLGTSDFKPTWGNKTTTKAVQDEFLRFLEHYRSKYEQARGSMTDVEATAAARTLIEKDLTNIMDVLEIPRQALTQVETRAALIYYKNALEEFHRLRRETTKRSNTPEQKQAAFVGLQAQGAVVDFLTERIAAWRREAGATTREYRGIDLKTKIGEAQAVQGLLDIAKRLGDVDPVKFGAMMNSLNHENEFLQFFMGLERLGRTSTQSVVSTYLEALLLNHQTVITRNSYSNLATLLFSVPKRQIAGLYGLFHRGPEHGQPPVALNEALQMGYGLMTGWTDALHAFNRMWKHGESTFSGMHKVPQYAPNLWKVLAERLPDGPFQSMAKALGYVWSLGSKGLMATDEASKALLYNMEIHAQAARYASFFAPGDDTAMTTLLTEFRRNPPDPVLKEAQRFARINTFQDQMGPLGQAFTELADAVPIPGRMIISFTQAPTRLQAMAWQHGPLAFASRQFMVDFAAGGARRDEALARFTMGQLTMLGTIGLHMNGWITGGGPADPTERSKWEARGWKPYSFWVPALGKYISYRDIEPLASILALTADFMDTYGVADGDALEKFSQGMVVAVSRFAMEQSWMESQSEFYETFGDLKGMDIQKTQKWITGRLLGFYPSELRVLRSTIDPVKRDTRSILSEQNDPLFAALRGFVNEWKNRTPWVSKDLPANLGAFGETLATRQLWGLGVLPFSVGDPVDPKHRFLYDHAIAAGVPLSELNAPVTVGGGSSEMRRPLGSLPSGAQQFLHQSGLEVPPRPIPGIMLTAQERHDFLKLREVAGFSDELLSLVSSNEYEQGSPGVGGTRASMLRKVVNTFNKIALADLRTAHAVLDLELERLGERKMERKEGLR